MRSALVVVALGLLGGCVSTNAAVLNPTVARARTCPEAVVVYTTPDRVKSQYDEVALLNSSGDYSMTTESGMVKSQQKKAAEVGANGLILNSMNDPNTGSKIAQALIGTSANRKGKAVAIWVSADSTKTRAICDSIAHHH